MSCLIGTTHDTITLEVLLYDDVKQDTSFTTVTMHREQILYHAAAAVGAGVLTEAQSRLPLSLLEFSHVRHFKLLRYLFDYIQDDLVPLQPPHTAPMSGTDITLPPEILSSIYRYCDNSTKIVWSLSKPIAGLPFWLPLLPYYPVLVGQLINIEYHSWSKQVRDLVLLLLRRHYTNTPDYRFIKDVPLPPPYQKSLRYWDAEHSEYGDMWRSPRSIAEHGRVCNAISVCWYGCRRGDSICNNYAAVIASVPQLPRSVRNMLALPAWLIDMIMINTDAPEYTSSEDVNLITIAADIYDWDVGNIKCLTDKLQKLIAHPDYYHWKQICQQNAWGDNAVSTTSSARNCGGYWIPRTQYMYRCIDNLWAAPAGTMQPFKSLITMSEVASLPELVAAVRHQYC